MVLIWESPKVDWTSKDYYNFYDLNRVESNNIALAEMLDTHCGVKIVQNTITNRTKRSIEFSDSLSRIENNIVDIGNGFVTPPGWETPKTDWQSGHMFNFMDSNRLENNQKLLYDWMTATSDNFNYCGTFDSGGDL